MSKPVYPVVIEDLSTFARNLGLALHQRHAGKAEPPGHVELLNLMARALGQRNWQALRVKMQLRVEAAVAQAMQPAAASPATAGLVPREAAAAAPAGPAAPAAVPLLSANARKALAQFDDQGRLLRWPVKYSVQKLAMWVLWTRFDAKRVYTEREVNAVLKAANCFSDHVTLRRELINHQLMARKSDCSEYRKLPVRPDEETRALLGAWRARHRGA